MEDFMEFIHENGKKIAIVAGGVAALAIGGVVFYVSKKKGEAHEEVTDAIEEASNEAETEE